MIIQQLAQLYSACLRLYPRSFQAEFAEEMREVFFRAAQEAQQESAFALGRLCVSELGGLAPSLVKAYRQAGAHQPATEAVYPGNPLEGAWRELLLALAVFLLPAMTGLASGTQPNTFAPGLFLVVMVIIGWLGGFPLWSLPYIGIVLAVAGYLALFQWVAGLVSPALIPNFSPGPWDPGAYLVLEIFSTGMLWLMLFCLTLLMVALLAIFNRFQPLLIRVRQDWTLLSYILYGESLFALLLLYQSHRFDANYTIASLLCFLAGVWFFLRSSGRRLRLLVLLVSLTCAIGIAALEVREPLLPSEAGRLLMAWAWMVAAVLLPGLLARLPVRRDRTPVAGL